MNAARKMLDWSGPVAASTLDLVLTDGRRLAPEPDPSALRPPSLTRFASDLLSRGLLSSHQLLQWRAHSVGGSGNLIRFLTSRGMVAPDVLYDLLAKTWSCPRLDPTRQPADPGLLDRLGVHQAIRLEMIPWRCQSRSTLIIASDPENFHRHQAHLTEVFGPVSMALAPWSEIEAAIHLMRGAELTRIAETAAPADRSSRSFDPTLWGPLAWALVLTIAAAALAAPGEMFLAGFVLVMAASIGFNLLKLAALVLDLFRPSGHQSPALGEADLPIISLLIPLYREEAVARKLVRRIGVLDYPADLLDILLIVEDDDQTTRRTLDLAELGASMRVISVPEGTIRTKPRALNYGVDQARGEIIGIYDAEDAPEPDHLRRVAARFGEGDQDLACIQGVLDFYNPRHNWLSRCFTIEYAVWFRLLLPGIARLGLVVPLGGTTLFLRRRAIDIMGRWDAHNVTEDADLGLRIARAGMRTELMGITTMEEANSRAIPWIKQRSRWIKGFMMTWLAHNRRTVQLWRDLGGFRFLGVQVLLLGSVIQALLAPLLWSLWIVPFGFAHPLRLVLPEAGFSTIMISFFAIEVLLVLVSWRAITKTRHRLSPLWVPTMLLYYPLATFAAWKAAWELFRVPHYWDKTSHGDFSVDVAG
jgi:cellulose synthase/poly-beta-1,6-N-acetylglucosamine synthase-like glycosyltransferase